MYAKINHKGPGHPWRSSSLDGLLEYPESYTPFMVVTQAEKDYLSGLSLMLGRELDVRLWETMVIGSNMFFTYVEIPDVSQGEQA